MTEYDHKRYIIQPQEDDYMGGPPYYVLEYFEKDSKWYGTDMKEDTEVVDAKSFVSLKKRSMETIQRLRSALEREEEAVSEWGHKAALHRAEADKLKLLLKEYHYCEYVERGKGPCVVCDDILPSREKKND